MKIVCPQCNASYMIPDNKVPKDKTVNATCKRCGKKFAVQSRGEIRPPQPTLTKEKAKVQISSESRPTDTGANKVIFDQYPDLQALPVSHFDFNQILTQNKDGSVKSRKNRFKVKILNAVGDIIPNILIEDELVVRIAKGTAHYPLEIFLGNGLLTMIYNHYAIVCTTKRILFINIDRRIMKPTHYIFQLAYREIKKISRGAIFGSLVFVPNRGKKRAFSGMKRALSKEIKEYVSEKTATPMTARSEHVHADLCPACYTGLEKGLSVCTTCNTAFKEPKKALIRSLIIPGMGDFYLGHRALGTLELIGSIIIWLIIITTLMSGEEGGVPFAVALLVLFNGLDGLLTYHMAKKGYMLA